MKTWVWMLLSVALLVPIPAAAQDDFARNGPYVGLAGTFAIHTKIEDELGTTVDVEDPLGLNARAGYRALPWLAAEAEFEWLSPADIRVPGFGSLATLESWALTLNAKGYPLTGRVQPYGLLGLGLMVAEAEALGLSDSEAGFAARFGAGVDLYVTPHIVGSLGVSYVLPTGDLEDLDYFSFDWGLAYRF